MRLLTVLRLLTSLQVLLTLSVLQAASSTPTAAQEPSPLEQQIKSLEDEISTGKARMKVLSDTKPEGWGDELRYLRDLDKQLREEKRQLREEKLLLLRKSDT